MLVGILFLTAIIESHIMCHMLRRYRGLPPSVVCDESSFAQGFSRLQRPRRAPAGIRGWMGSVVIDAGERILVTGTT